MVKIIPIEISDKKELKIIEREIGLEEIIWQGGKFIRKKHISMVTAPNLKPEPLGYPKAFTGLTPHLHEEDITKFILYIVNEQGLDGRANAYSMNRKTFGFCDVNTIISIQLYHINQL
jgi:hypothetical protein